MKAAMSQMKASSNLMNASSSLSPSSTSITQITDNNNSNLSNNNNNNTSRYKNYLIEKLLNESITPLQNTLKPSTDILFQVNTSNNNSNNNINVTNGSNGLNDSREDLTSETGTYVIDEPVATIRQSHSNNANNLKQSTNTIDLMSARAAIGKLLVFVLSQFCFNKLNITNFIESRHIKLRIF